MSKSKTQKMFVSSILSFLLLCNAGCNSAQTSEGTDSDTSSQEAVEYSTESIESAQLADASNSTDATAVTDFTGDTDLAEEGSDESEVVTPDVNDYVRVLDYIPDIVVDLRYATADNFTGQVIYNFTDAYLRYGTVLKLMAAQEQFKELGYRIKIWDAYRPFYAQEKMWEIYPNATYVANPAKGMHGHNLGGTIDITLVTLDGEDVEMPTEFDNFSTLADRDYSEISEPAASNALLLQTIMYQNDFTGYSGEWWDFTDNTTYTEIDDFVPPDAQ